MKRQIELELEILEEDNAFYPWVKCVVNYLPAYPARIRYDENDHPAESAEVELLEYVVVKDDGCEWVKNNDDKTWNLIVNHIDKHFEWMVNELKYEERMI